MASVQPPLSSSSTQHQHDTYSRYRIALSVPASLSAHIAPFPPPLFRPSYDDERAMPPPPVPSYAGRKRKHAADGPSSPSAPDSSGASSPEGDSEYDPRTMQPAGASRTAPRAQKRPSSKPGSSASTPAPKGAQNGRPMSREQLRKANHSLIERRRREKINYALSELRSMVPGLGEDNGGKGGEFKLEVLERTVIHMRELKRQIADLEVRLGNASRVTSRRRTTTSDDSMDVDMKSEARYPTPPKHRSTPPSPSVTPPPQQHLEIPDPNETEEETNLPPPLTVARRTSDEDSSGHTASPHPPSISSLLQSSHSSASNRTITGRGGQTASPNIYLPFPTPSPTSPFLTYHPSSASTASSATGPPEPSPFLAPMQNISLFNGALDTPVTGPMNASKQPSPPDLGLPPARTKRDLRDMGAEEAASVLLAISSPDTMRPSSTTPLMAAAMRDRRLLDAEEFMLDGGIATDPARPVKGSRHQGKTARDILRM